MISTRWRLLIVYHTGRKRLRLLPGRLLPIGQVPQPRFLRGVLVPGSLLFSLLRTLISLCLLLLYQPLQLLSDLLFLLLFLFLLVDLVQDRFDREAHYLDVMGGVRKLRVQSFEMEAMPP